MSSQLPSGPPGAPGPRRRPNLGIVDALVQSSFLVQAVLDQAAAEHDVSIVQARLLGVLRDREPRMAQLAQLLELTKSSITGLVDRAEKRGLLRRAPNPVDGRATDVFLTAEGLQLADLGEAKIARSLSPMTGTLTRTETLRLTALLEHVLKQEGP